MCSSDLDCGRCGAADSFFLLAGKASMKFTLLWLKEHLDTDASLTEIVDKLTMIGLEVESVDNPAENLAAAGTIRQERRRHGDRP